MLIALLAAAAAAAPALAPVVIQNPDWLKVPDATQIGVVWPTDAFRRGIGGSVGLRCIASIHGRMENCVVESETPEGMGFGAAALSLTPSFLMKPMTRDGQPVPSTVRIPIRFIVAGEIGALADLYRQEATIRRPIWRAAPTFAQVAAAYPPAAAGVSGLVVLSCRVWVDGGLNSCETLDEEPTGKAFDHAARSIVGRFRMQTTKMMFKGVTPAYVRVRIRLVDPKSAEFQSRRVSQPSWIGVADAATLAAAFPAAAAAGGVKTGHGVASCVVGAAGGLADCRPMPSGPSDMGFSEAAAKVASGMRMNPWTDDGGPVDGATVEVPISFNLVAAPTASSEAP